MEIYKNRWNLSIFLHFALLAGALLYFVDFTHYAPTLALPVQSLAQSGSIYLNPYISPDNQVHIAQKDGLYFSDKPPLPFLLVLPFYWAANQMLGLLGIALPFSHTTLIHIIGAIVTGIAPFLGIIAITFKRYRGHILQKKLSPLLLFLPFVGSYLFVYSTAFCSHILAGFWLLLAYRRYQQRQFVWMGIFSGLLFITEYFAVILPAFWLLFGLNRHSFGQLLRFALGILPFGLFQMAYNYMLTGHPFVFPYYYSSIANGYETVKATYGFQLPNLFVFVKLLFGDYRGLFLYAPALLLAIKFFLLDVPFNKWKHYLMHPFFLAAVCFLLLLSSHFVWWGGWCYGPRYLIPLAVVSLYGLSGYAARQSGKIFPYLALLSGIGLAFALLARSITGFYLSEHIQHPFLFLLEEAKLGHFSTYNFASYLFGIPPVYVVGFWITATGLLAWLVHLLYRSGR